MGRAVSNDIVGDGGAGRGGGLLGPHVKLSLQHCGVCQGQDNRGQHYRHRLVRWGFVFIRNTADIRPS